jgi:ankyrin repeat protein
VDTNGKTPLFEAAEEGHCDVVQLLLAAGASVNASTKTGSYFFSTSLHNSS